MHEIIVDDIVFNSEFFRDSQIPDYFHKTSQHQKLYLFLKEWFSDDSHIQLHTSGSTGEPKQITVEKRKMLQSANMTCNFFNLKENDKALLCLSADYIGGKMMVVRAICCRLNLHIVEPSGNPLKEASQYYDFAAMVPLQVYNSIKDEDGKERLAKIKNLIVGGSPIDKELEGTLRNFPNSVYSTYGMTETLSHIGLRKINGEKPDSFYIPLPGVSLKLSDEQTLIIDAPLLSDQLIVTNDIVEIKANNTFRILGRIDNVINTGGMKVQAEEVEQQLRPYIMGNFVVTSIPHSKLGECIVLLADTSNNEDYIKDIAEKVLPQYQQPKHFITVTDIPITGNGKTDRASAKKLAQDIHSNI